MPRQGPLLSRSPGAWPSATTRLAAVIGDPVRHSLSPVLHNAAFQALGLDWAYLAFAVEEGDVARALDGVRALGIDGLNVTMPHKSAVAAGVDRLSPTADALGAVNTVVRQGGLLVGESTDGQGLLDALRADEGFDPAGCRCVVLGAGGAARAVVLALAEAGASEVAVVARRHEAATRAAALAGAAGAVVGVEAVANARLVVQATPIGMEGRPGMPLGLDPAWLGPGQLVADLVYAPPATELVRVARAAGAVAVNGLGMLVHQAARSFQLWTGEAAPLGAMSAAALAVLVAGGPPAR